MLKEKLEQIKLQYAQFKAQRKKHKIISISVFAVDMLSIAVLALLRSLNVIYEGNEGMLLITMSAIVLVSMLFVMFLPKVKGTDAYFYKAWIGVVLEEYCDVLALNDSSAKIVIENAIEDGIHIYRKDKNTPKLIIKPFNYRIDGNENEIVVIDNIGVAKHNSGIDISDSLCVFYSKKINQGRVYSNVSTYIYFAPEDKNLSDEDTLWETIVENGELTKDAVSNVKIANMR